MGSVIVSVAGVCAVSPPEPVFDWPEAVQLADQVKVASPLRGALALTDTAVGWEIVADTVHVAFAPDPVQDADPFACATDMPAVMPPTVRTLVMTT